ncbi:MAG TPA: cupredoxin domain-containing protein [Candidatus Binataceae bacterium]|nr:cupredoxin domain-containing protein [Candidatus Binataceae bacterium]
MIKLALRTFAATLIIGTLAASVAPAAHAQESAPAAAPSTTTAGSSDAAPGEKKFTVVSELIGDTKFWLPSTIVVEAGDKVTLNLKNEVPGTAVTHGFELPAYHISEIVTRGEKPKVVHFTADKPGIYPYYCQLHGAHIGGQLVVETKRE